MRSARPPNFGTYFVNRALLARLMKKLDLSQAELHRQSGVDTKTIRRALKDGGPDTGDVLKLLASAFNRYLDPSEHLSWTDLVDAARQPADPSEDLVSKFRECFAGLHSQIEPPGLPGVDRYHLDQLFVSPRLAPDSPAAPLEAWSGDALLARTRHLAVLGSPGSGKTTWLRWTFRQLLARPDALPIPIDLRGFARSWDASRRNVLGYLGQWLSEYMTVDAALAAELEQLLKASDGPRPVLLLDSWDQLGDSLGAELHDKLDAFLRTHRRVLTVVTSRLYGKGRPGRNDNFEVVELQPLDEAEMSALVQRYGAVLRAGGNDAWYERIAAAIRVSPQVNELARNPLLLTMMVGVGRDRELPGKRHVLYQRCIEEMLVSECKTATHWRPALPDDALRAVEHLAFGLQDFAYARSTSDAGDRRSVAVDVDQASSYLPGAWSIRQREYFLDWLVEACGILVRDQGTYAFAHLSLQEYLAAVFISHHPEVSITDRVFDLHWWETLRVLAALVDREAADRRIAELLSVSFDRSQPASFWLAGAVLADGHGHAFDAWLDHLRDRFRAGEWRYARQTALAWRTSHPPAARARIAFDGAGWTWVRWVRATEWATAADLGDSFHMWNDGVGLRSARAVAAAFDPEARWTPDTVALSRILHGSGPFWPAPRWELMLLRTWPSRRARLGQALQLLASVGADRALLVDAAGLWLDELDRPFLLLTAELERAILAQPELDVEPRDAYARALARDLGVQFGNRVGTELAELPSVAIAAAEWARQLAQSLRAAPIAELARPQLAELCRRIAHESRPDLGRPWANATVRALSERGVQVSAADPIWLDFGLVESHARARHTTATALAFSADAAGDGADERVAIIAAACRQRLQVGAQDFEPRVARAHGIDPIWPALGRCLSGTSDDADHELLARAAARADHGDPVLQSGLRYHVRGDVVTDDGELTLDEICDALHHARLPLLEPPRPAARLRG